MEIIAEGKKGGKRVAKKKKISVATSADSLAMVEVDDGTPALGASEKKGMITLEIRENASILSQLKPLDGEEEKLLLPRDESIMDDMELDSVAVEGIIDGLWVSFDFSCMFKLFTWSLEVFFLLFVLLIDRLSSAWST